MRKKKVEKPYPILSNIEQQFIDNLSIELEHEWDYYDSIIVTAKIYYNGDLVKQESTIVHY
jgi:hypothetical protein